MMKHVIKIKLLLIIAIIGCESIHQSDSQIKNSELNLTETNKKVELYNFNYDTIFSNNIVFDSLYKNINDIRYINFSFSFRNDTIFTDYLDAYSANIITVQGSLFRKTQHKYPSVFIAQIKFDSFANLTQWLRTVLTPHNSNVNIRESYYQFLINGSDLIILRGFGDHPSKEEYTNELYSIIRNTLPNNYQMLTVDSLFNHYKGTLD